MEEFEHARQPHCLHCGTALSDVVGGYICRSCDLTYLPHVSVLSDARGDRPSTG